MKLIIHYWQSDDDWKHARMTVATIPVNGIGDAIQVVKNWYWKINSWKVEN